MISKDNFWSSVLAAGGIGELSTGNAVFDRRARCVWRVLESTLVAAQDVAQVECWEDVLELVPGAGLPLVERKAAVLRVLCEELPFTVALLPGRLRQLLGEGNFTVTQEDDRVTVAVSLDTTEAQIEESRALLDRVLPRNLVTEMEWADGLPIDYTRLEYLESTGTQYILTRAEVKGSHVKIAGRCTVGAYRTIVHNGTDKNDVILCQEPGANDLAVVQAHARINDTYYYNTTYNLKFGDNFETEIDIPNGKSVTNGTKVVTFQKDYYKWEKNTYPLFARAHYSGDDETPGNIISMCSGILKSAVFANYGVQTANFIPALDPTGTPCMFDLVTRTPFYNAGTGDFTYPGKETEATTYSLRNRMYAQYTEHGIRRLYRVPDGYSSKEEYAAANGFKILVETPMPEEGYWTPVWHDREDCIELEWVECEPPAETAEGEVSEN